MNTTVFTIEQVDLIRRLRKTGIPLDKLIYAYKEMDRLERENCQQQQLPQLKSNNALNSFTTIAASFNNSSLSHGNGSTSGPLSISHLNTNNNSNNNSINSGQQLQLDPLSINNDSLANNYEANLSNAGNNSLFGMGLQPSTSKNLSDSGDLHNNLMNKYALQPIMLQNSSLTDEQNELMEFKKKGENAMLMEIRTFVAKYNIRQNMVGEMVGISQGYISRFFRGEGQDISERAKNLIYSWYLNFRRNPMKILQSCPMTVGDRKMISDSGDLLPIRRDRFIFRKQHLNVLEQYFNENPYPDTHTKEQIADECNQAAERLSTRPLSEKDKVTTSIVSNWFNNKRKDTKMSRQSQEIISQQHNSDSNSSPLTLNNQNNNSLANSSSNGTQQNENGSNGTNSQNQQSGSQSIGQQNNQGSYYYRDSQPLKLETYPDLPIYQGMEEEESEPEVE